MCLAIPGRVTAVYETNGLQMGKMEFGGVLKEVCLAFLPDLSVGNYAIVHVGFAISKVDETVALETLRNFHELGSSNEDLT
jgi:hydrogenase expression/formation protein HypC